MSDKTGKVDNRGCPVAEQDGPLVPNSANSSFPSFPYRSPFSMPSMMYPMSTMDRLYAEMMENMDRVHSEMERLYQTHLAPSLPPSVGYPYHQPDSPSYGLTMRPWWRPSYWFRQRQNQQALESGLSSSNQGEILPVSQRSQVPFSSWGDIMPFGYWGRDGLTGHRMPRVDIQDRASEIVVQADVPGMNRENLKVDLHDGVLTIRGEQREDRKQEDQGFYLQERSQASFSRSFVLPDKVNEDGVKASLVNGVLQVHIPKENPTAPPAVKNIRIE
ncbi:heat shock protein hsp28 [Cystoisospora suis]|uniref:Heat shock protein hsp28 n=1 Tax=Cystoisospora suis TaxID=483139 RepID=A0A2C6KQN2_9APIC|nr:heat shock protein hsp28 [Cystoisospora suis]